jgi:peptidoglycan/xylan/chitin deacetylase (PgdA/CDA1 family)
MQPPLLFRKLFRSFVWRIPTKDLVLFLTFDDGPVPGVTPAVLELLREYNAKATFFCIGDNVQKHPEVFQQVINEGHAIGNHTYNHLNGWKTRTEDYILNIDKCHGQLKSEIRNPQSAIDFFRPPYGKLSISQYLKLKLDYSIIMWDVLSKDWKQHLTGDDCFGIVKKKAKPGSIIVFHDSLKAEARMLPALEKILKYFSERGFRFDRIPSQA